MLLPIVLLWGFQKCILPYLAGESLFQRTSQGWPDRMHIKTILNRIEKQPGFIYDTCRWRDSGPPALVITLRPQVGSKPICSKCGEKRPGYDTLRVRSFAFVPLWGIPVFFLYAPQTGAVTNLWRQSRKVAMGCREKPSHSLVRLVPGRLVQTVELEGGGRSL